MRGTFRDIFSKVVRALRVRLNALGDRVPPAGSKDWKDKKKAARQSGGPHTKITVNPLAFEGVEKYLVAVFYFVLSASISYHLGVIGL